MDLQLPSSRSNTLVLPLGCRLTPLTAIDAGLGSILDVEPSSPFDQVRLEPGLEVPQDLPQCVPIYLAFHRKLSIGSLLSLPARRVPAGTSTRLRPRPLRPKILLEERSQDGPTSDT